MPSDGSPQPPEPWWLRALEPLRSEAAMFRVLVGVVVVCGTIIALTLLARALF